MKILSVFCFIYKKLFVTLERKMQMCNLSAKNKNNIIHILWIANFKNSLRNCA